MKVAEFMVESTVACCQVRMRKEREHEMRQKQQLLARSLSPCGKSSKWKLAQAAEARAEA